MIFFTSDEHYDHKNILKYQKRPFDTVEKMNEELIKRHNEMIAHNDTVYHIGDFSFCNPDKILKQLNGNQKGV